MANVSNKTILKLYWTRRPYGKGGNEKGAYIDYFLIDIIEDIVAQDKVKEFAKLWRKKMNSLTGQKTLMDL